METPGERMGKRKGEEKRRDGKRKSLRLCVRYAICCSRTRKPGDESLAGVGGLVRLGELDLKM